MLPTMGLYKNLDCPYYEKSCSRPYCHFRHRKKHQDIEPPASASTEIPTYNPTPKSQLASVRSHIPISYVPDLAVRSENSTYRMNTFSEKFPVYKPTPLSILSTGKTVVTEENTDNSTNGDVESEDFTKSIDVEDKELKILTTELDKTKTKTKSEKSKNDKKSKDSKSRSHSKSKSRHDCKKDNKTRHKSKRDDKHKSSGRSRSKSKDKHKSRHKDKHKSRETKKPVEKDTDNGNIDFNLDESDEEDPMEECYKIFNEYKPTEPEIFPEVVKPVEEQPIHVSKKRIAHENIDKNKPKTFNVSKPAAPTAAQVMINRYKAIKQMQIENEKKLDVVAEINKHLKRPAEIVLEKAPIKQVKAEIVKPVPAPSTSLIDDILSGKSSKPRRIAPVQNVNSIQRAKAKIEEMAKVKAANALKTSTQTVSKGSKRVAHVPEVSISDVPEVLEAERSKLPVNVRSRYLSMIFDECVKLYLSTADAQQRAVNEEYKVYERCSALVTYRNSAMLAINRLRKELQEREASGLGPILPGDTSCSIKDDGSDIKGLKFYNNIKQLILSEEELVQHGFPREGSKPGKGVVPNQKQVSKVGLDEYDRVCCRCSKIYRVDEEGFALYEEECIYHPLKKRTFRGESFYLCCKSGEGSGCVTAATHVSDILSTDNEIDGFQTTMSPESDNDPRSVQVFALDCEMCYTTKGLELTRVTIVNADCKTVYETLVKPFNPIIDYNTRFSGITKEQMNRTATSILQVQANILHLCNSNTILIGHSLESDMKALKIIHSTIIDTSVLFPHKFGLPHKRALRDLAREFLKKIIQNDVSGHDSAEDALTCMELVQWKVKESLKARGLKA